MRVRVRHMSVFVSGDCVDGHARCRLRLRVPRRSCLHPVLSSAVVVERVGAVQSPRWARTQTFGGGPAASSRFTPCDSVPWIRSAESLDRPRVRPYPQVRTGVNPLRACPWGTRDRSGACAVCGQGAIESAQPTGVRRWIVGRQRFGRTVFPSLAFDRQSLSTESAVIGWSRTDYELAAHSCEACGHGGNT